MLRRVRSEEVLEIQTGCPGCQRFPFGTNIFFHTRVIELPVALARGPGHRECARVFDSEGHFEGFPIINTAVAFDDVDLIRMRSPVIVDRSLWCDADRIDDQRVTFVVPYEFAVP